MYGKEGRRLFIPLVQRTFPRLRIGSCDAICRADPQDESVRIGQE